MIDENKEVKEAAPEMITVSMDKQLIKFVSDCLEELVEKGVSITKAANIITVRSKYIGLLTEAKNQEKKNEG